jgi:hypothetical protein
LDKARPRGRAQVMRLGNDQRLQEVERPRRQSVSMTDQAISPSRRCVIEAMTIRSLSSPGS